MSAVARIAAIVLLLAGCGAPPAARVPSAPEAPDVATIEAGENRFDAGDFAAAARTAEDLLAVAPERLDARMLLARARYRQGRFGDAAAGFAAVLEADPDHDDARLGLAYADLQRGDLSAAAAGFARVAKSRDADRDALRGLVLVARRPDATPPMVETGREAARRLVALDPEDRDLKAVLLALEARLGGPGEVRWRGAREAHEGAPRYDARAGRDYLEIRDGDGWVPVFVKGFNLGAARPGKFPTQFPEDEATWRDWLAAIADLGANTVRTYTLLPPAFYRALVAHNAAGTDDRLWLLQGVWTELPPRHDFLDPEYLASFEAEIARVIDAVHGDLALAPRPGHAHGVYDVDASSHVLGWIVGREWEPFAVVDFNAMHPDLTAWTGAWFEADGAAMECWVARTLDFAAGHEARRHGVVRPLSFANWPTLDPLHHPTESTRAEEDRWRKHYGVPYPESLAEAPWEDDRVALDATRIRATARMPAGAFASYHVYPNFPDFLNLDPSYAEGPSRYAAYLEDLEAYHGDQPVLIAEFGISTSRGIAHVQPRGRHHGGHDEREQGALVARMLRTIHDAGYAGGIVFAFQDEWFKGTWSTAPWELPAERRRLWWSAESPEQSYGVMAYRPGRAGIRVDGDASDWRDVPVLASSPAGALREMRVTSDEGHLYFLLRTDGSRVGLRVALDTLDRARGSNALPEPGPFEVDRGVDFVVDLLGPDDSRVRVVDGYEPASRRDGGVLLPPPVGDHPFVRLLFEANRERFGRDGTRYPAVVVERGRLRYGSLDPASPVYDTRTDVSVGSGTGTIEIRIPWGLLNVADPSSRRALVRHASDTLEYDTAPIDAFAVKIFAFDPSSPKLPPSATLPRGDGFATYRWDGWDEPTWTFEPKAGVEEIRRTMRAIPTRVERGEER